MLSNLGPRARDVSGPGLRSEVMMMKVQVVSLEEVVRRLAEVSEKMVERRSEEVVDMSSMARELGNISNNTAFR